MPKSRPKKLRVIYEGHAYNSGVAVRNFVGAICAVVREHSLEKVRSLGLMLSGHDLIQIGRSTALSSKDCGTFHVAVHSDIDEKAEVLRQLKRALRLDMDVRVLSPAERIAEARQELLE